MAETCIVCLGDLAFYDAENALDADPSLNNDPPESAADAISNNHHFAKLASSRTDTPLDETEHVAHLLPCGHNLHNECLKPWVERANSCPICRASFNTVELSAKIGGPILSSYPVQDKLQVPDLDLSMLVEEEPVPGDDYNLEDCMVCADLGDPTQLMQCHACEQLCHVFCAGLDIMPSRGPWYCRTCMEDPETLALAGRRVQPRNPAAFSNGRFRRRRGSRQEPNAWARVWQSVWDRLHLDLDFPFDDDVQSQTHSERMEAQRREYQQWERRLEIARRSGAGNRFRQSAAPLLEPRHREAPKTLVAPESQEELRAWNQFEKAREQLEGGSSSTTNRRKRRSPTASPSENDRQEPQRKLKRPRTRMTVDVGESSKENAGEPSSAAPAPETRNISSPAGMRDGLELATAAGGFLQSLLQEVEKTPPEKETEIAAPQPRRVIIERACSPQNSSPGLSPVYPTPRGMTPPPLNISSRPHSPQLQSSPMLSPGYSPDSRFPPYSPADEEARPGRRKRGQQSPGALSSPPRSKDSSPARPNMSYSTKAEIQRMVTVALKPRYIKKEIGKDEYTDINRDISRMLYDRVGDATALAEKDTREKWQKIAEDEVENAIKALRASSASASDDTGTSSSSSA